MTFYRRGRGGRREELAAAAAAAAAGLVVFYLARLWLRREPVGPLPSAEGTSTRPGGASSGEAGGEP